MNPPYVTSLQQGVRCFSSVQGSPGLQQQQNGQHLSRPRSHQLSSQPQAEPQEGVSLPHDGASLPHDFDSHPQLEVAAVFSSLAGFSSFLVSPFFSSASAKYAVIVPRK